MENYIPAPERYATMPYRRCGTSGLKLPPISLGCWFNFGGDADDAACREMLHGAFDLGVTHFDLANNYGPPAGSAEERVGKILKSMPRDELIISTKAGYLMWDGPYGEWGSRKYLLASLDQSLRRLNLDYVDIFYSHRPDEATPLEETLGALDTAVRSGRALYAGISSYSGEMTARVLDICQRDRLVAPIIHQPYYNMLNRWIEPDLLPVTGEGGMGVIAFCPLARGLLTDRYVDGVPKGTRGSDDEGWVKQVASVQDRLRRLRDVATERGQSVAQLVLTWTLRDPRVTSALIGASRVEQVRENVAALSAPPLSAPELEAIEAILA